MNTYIFENKLSLIILYYISHTKLPHSMCANVRNLRSIKEFFFVKIINFICIVVRNDIENKVFS